MKQKPTRWEATTTPGLYVRQPGGGFYTRVTPNGKRSWRPLKTNKLRTAQQLPISGTVQEWVSAAALMVNAQIHDVLASAC